MTKHKYQHLFALVHHRMYVRMIFLAFAGAMLLAFSGTLANAHAKVAQLDREFKLKAGEQVNLKRTRLRIKFVTVENDSRCPKDVTCVWAGNAAVRFQLSVGRRSKTVTLNTNGNATFVREVEYQGYRVNLVDLSPSPLSKQKIAASAYTATLVVGKK